MANSLDHLWMNSDQRIVTYNIAFLWYSAELYWTDNILYHRYYFRVIVLSFCSTSVLFSISVFLGSICFCLWSLFYPFGQPYFCIFLFGLVLVCVQNSIIYKFLFIYPLATIKSLYSVSATTTLQPPLATFHSCFLLVFVWIWTFMPPTCSVLLLGTGIADCLTSNLSVE